MKLILFLLILPCAMGVVIGGKFRRLADPGYTCNVPTNEIPVEVQADAADNRGSTSACDTSTTTVTILKKNFGYLYANARSSSPFLNGALLCEKKNHYCSTTANPTGGFSYQRAVIFNWLRDKNRQVWLGTGACVSYDGAGNPVLTACTTSPVAYKLETLTFDKYQSLPLENRCAGTFEGGVAVNGRNCTAHVWQAYQYPIGVGQFWTHWLYNFKKRDGTASTTTSSVIPTSTSSTAITAVSGNQWAYSYLMALPEVCGNTLVRREDESPEEHLQRAQDTWDFITLTAKSTVETIYDEEEYARRKRDVESPRRKEWVNQIIAGNSQRQLAAMCYIDQEVDPDEEAVEAFGDVQLNKRSAIICLVKTTFGQETNADGETVYNAVTALISAIYAESRCTGGPNGKIWEKASEVIELQKLGYALAHPIMQCSCVAANNMDTNHPSMNGKTPEEIEDLRRTLCAAGSFGYEHPDRK